MKRMLLIVFVLMQCLAFISCNQLVPPSTSEGVVGGESNTDESNTEVIIMVTPATINCNNYEEYREFIETSGRISDKFVSYEDVSSFGDFRGFHSWCSPYEENDVSERMYYYELYVNGYYFILSIGKNSGEDYFIGEKGSLNDQFISVCDKTDMRTTGSEELGTFMALKGTFVFSGIEYSYWDGELENIKWKIDGVLYELSAFVDRFGNSVFDDPTSIAGQMMDVEKALEIVAGLSKS